MILRNLTICASPDADPNTVHSYEWNEGSPIEHLESGIAKLQETVDRLKALRNDPLAAAKPIVTCDASLVFQTPK